MSNHDKFEPPADARFFIATDFDGNDASFFVIPGSKPGFSKMLARDGSPAMRAASAGGKEVSRAEFEAWSGSDGSRTPSPPASE